MKNTGPKLNTFNCSCIYNFISGQRIAILLYADFIILAAASLISRSALILRSTSAGMAPFTGITVNTLPPKSRKKASCSFSLDDLLPSVHLIIQNEFLSATGIVHFPLYYSSTSIFRPVFVYYNKSFLRQWLQINAPLFYKCPV